ncbi:MAG TPA: PDZ domain-containing protein [Chloroflexi bacterium]|nr:PDZ domain-containing protein [Chloroflexota bacterium]
MMRRKHTLIAGLVIFALITSACGFFTPGVINRIIGRGQQTTPTLSVELETAVPVEPEPQVTPTPTADQAPEETPEPASPGEKLPLEAGSGEMVLALQQAYQEIYDRLLPSVVNIYTAVPITGGFGLPPDHPAIPEDDNLAQALGSGFVWDKEGHIVTNYHVVEGARQIQVAFSDGTIVDAELVGSAPGADLAVVRVDLPAEMLVPVTMGDSSQLDVGQLVVAIGNPFGFEGSMSTGIISALGRDLPVGESINAPRFVIPNIIQTDAPINPGNSGGVLANLNGEVIGVNTAIQSPVRGSVGLGFAVPANIVRRVVPALIETGEFQFPYLGISGTSLTPAIREAMGLDPAQRGVLIAAVTPGGPAEEAGLRGSEASEDGSGRQILTGGDIITAIDGIQVSSINEISAYLVEQTEVGQEVTLTILREGETMEVPVTLQARSSGTSAQISPPASTETPAPEEEPGEQQPASGAYLGITGIDLTPELAGAMDLPEDATGALVVQVAAGSPARRAGLRASFTPALVDGQLVFVGGDVIIALDGEPVDGMDSLRALLAERTPGEEVTLTVLRGGEEVEVPVTLGARD